MIDTPGTAAPSLAAHSKDASTPGPTPASSATGQTGSGAAAGTARQIRDAIGGRGGLIADQLAGFARDQPITALATVGGIGLILGILLARR
ncbi:MAG: hypothetical protein JOY70_04135 [Acidisphaera sp.]|nr:hypothetical protein [Acidisphaera sp.]